MGKDAIKESVHSEEEASAAIAAILVFDLPNPLDDLLNEDLSTALDALAPTPLMVVKLDGETIIETTPIMKAKSIAIESTISPTTPRGTKR
ncbi:hypothetical protein V6N13_043472 [Hibiscus sabdariffa]|uniref:Uncharacterized protein n=1 Tax=Hibiscus sabdariffa TaxID=183260 RepID=A0ABR2G1Q0_9ROSI